MLSCPYEAAKARLVLREMADQLSLELVEKGLVTDQVVLTVGYDIEKSDGPGPPHGLFRPGGAGPLRAARAEGRAWRAEARRTVVLHTADHGSGLRPV